MRSLNRREHEVRQYIELYIHNKGYSPSIREIAKAIELDSTSSVSYILDSMEGKGALKRDFGIPRSIVLQSNNLEGAQHV